jgi:RNA polymerase sigma factor (sigma-70 family)
MSDPLGGPQPSDEELVFAARSAASKTEKDQAVARLLDRYRSRIFVWCLRYQPDREAALDLTQEILIRTYRGLPSYQGRSRFSSWLFAVTRNECLKSLRGNTPPQSAGLDPDLLPGPAADPERQLLETLAEQDMLNLIRDTLEPLERKALWLRCFDRLPVASITELLEISDRTGARAILQKARRKLRAALDARDAREA